MICRVTTFLVLMATVSALSVGQRSVRSSQLTRVNTRLLSAPNFDSKRISTALNSEAQATIASSSSSNADSKGLANTLKVGGFFGLWYALNIGYNIYNKKVLTIAPQLTWTIALIQLFVGLFYVFPVWAFGVRKAPVLNQEEIKNLIPVTLAHLFTHVGAIISLGAGAVSFTHIVKAAEPAVSAGLSAVFLKQFLPWQVSLTLLPVMGGVAMASLTELSFSWTSFIAAMISNVASASRGIIGKISMGKPQGQNMDASNLYAVMTIMSTILLFPLVLIIEGGNILPTINALSASGKLNTFITQTLLSSLFYYSYNEVAFLTLDKVAPVTHALGNTIKRVVIILTSVIVFGTKMTSQGALGSSIAILGVLLYSLAKNKFK